MAARPGYSVIEADRVTLRGIMATAMVLGAQRKLGTLKHLKKIYISVWHPIKKIQVADKKMFTQLLYPADHHPQK